MDDNLDLKEMVSAINKYVKDMNEVKELRSKANRISSRANKDFKLISFGLKAYKNSIPEVYLKVNEEMPVDIKKIKALVDLNREINKIKELEVKNSSQSYKPNNINDYRE